MTTTLGILTWKEIFFLLNYICGPKMRRLVEQTFYYYYYYNYQ